ncbi:hypothetical protein B0W47_05635 [Komagataeibacter nataicola]|uniref:Uncharacterized protein n=1 Tax=Komagataeibacter nataicola TaxID=265960 RepID=A0A9N7H0S8_9PROT|nr:hypothetical protein B0W47_05635 [Komagataeibacter nataicola]PYD65064.1 hypothetical protein CDI09_15620 [Komagataeibacter nataicola]
MTGDLPVPRALAPVLDSRTPEQRCVAMALVGRGTGETKKRSLAFHPDMHPNEGLSCCFVYRDAPAASVMIHIRIMFLPAFYRPGSSGQLWPASLFLLWKARDGYVNF